MKIKVAVVLALASVMAFGMLGGVAFAEPTVYDQLGTGISDTISDILGLLTDNLGVILSLVGAIVGLTFVVGLLRRFGRG